MGGRAFNLRLFLDNRKRLKDQQLLFTNSICRIILVTHHIVVSFTKGRGVGHSTIHDPSLGLILGTDKVLDFAGKIRVSQSFEWP